MEAKDLKYFERLLFKKKKELEERLANLEEKFTRSQQESSSDLSAYPLHMADLGSDTEFREGSSCLITSTVDELNKVNRALEKIHSKTYGSCEECGKEIGMARLKAVPYAELCIKCGAKS